MHTFPGRFPALLAILALSKATIGTAAEPKLRFNAPTAAEAQQWQADARETLFRLMMGGRRPDPVPLEPKVAQRVEVPASGCVLEEVTFASLPDRRVHAWVSSPARPRGRVGAVLALHGHGGTGEQIVKGLGLYWYGRAFAEQGYVVISPDIGQHDLQHPDWSLMGERVWDALRCVDYLLTRPEVDPERLVVAGLSLGGETTMYVAALDPRLKAACSSGWLTTVANMKQGHCPCWNFPGLEEHFDFADIFACVAPRPLVLELGEKERAPGGFPVSTGRLAFEGIQRAYRVLGAERQLALAVHPAGHVFNGREFWPMAREALGPSWPWGAVPEAEAELARRGEVARRCFSRALGVVEGWWKLRDPLTGLLPRRVDQPVWAPNDNAADLFPFLALTAYVVAPHRLDEILETIPAEQQWTTRWKGLPDWFALTNRAFLHPTIDTNRLIFGAAEYCKDGLLPMTELMGRGVWTDRMFGLMDALFEAAPFPSDFGPLPANDTEVNGDLLQVLCRLYFLTGDRRFLERATRIGDAYCLEVLPRSGFIPPYRWDFVAHRSLADELNLNDHGNEIVGGLSELLVAASHGDPPRAARYREPLERMARRLLETARNGDGFWVQRLQPSTGQILDPVTPDTWGYALSGIDTLGAALGQPFGRDAAMQALAHLDRPAYLDWNGADAYADSIEGGLLLLNRYPIATGWEWLARMLPLFLGKQRDDGVVEGWYGDGNYARTALMAGLYHTQGTRCLPWHAGLAWGASAADTGLEVRLESTTDWQGRLILDRPRHRLHLRLPTNYPRLNEFPEWFTVEAERPYEVRCGAAEPETRTGAQLAEGFHLSLKAQQAVIVSIRPKS